MHFATQGWPLYADAVAMTFLKDAWQALAKRLNGLRRPPPAPQVLRIKSKGKVQRPGMAVCGDASGFGGWP